MNVALQTDELTEDEVAIGLLDRGLFADNMPRCFTTEGLYNQIMKQVESDYLRLNSTEKKLTKLLQNKFHDYIRYNSLRDTNIPRHFGIPHPESYVFQVFAIKQHWLDIQKHCQSPTTKVSRIHVRRCEDGQIFKMKLEKSLVDKNKEIDLEKISGMSLVVEADIATCYTSIYTHSIPWALNGKNHAKKERSILNNAGNLLDKTTQGLRDGQTNGLLIGPASSSIISEIILTTVDANLCTKGFSNVRRYIDDYKYYAKDNQDAQSFLHELGILLRNYELAINDKKTTISKIPSPKRDAWVGKLRQFSFPKNKSLSYSDIEPLLDLSLDLSIRFSTYAPINYALNMISKLMLDTRSKSMMIQHCMNLSLAIPYLVKVMDELVFEKQSFDGIHAKIESYANRLLEVGINRLYTDSIAYSIYYACRYKIKLNISDNILESLLRINDCICFVLQLDFSLDSVSSGTIVIESGHSLVSATPYRPDPCGFN